MTDATAVARPAQDPGARRALRARIALLVAVLGPGLLAGLSDDDPAGITTYSVLGARFGYQLLWVLLLATGALILFHGLGARLGVITGQGLIGLIRQRYGVRLATVAILALSIANLGTTCAEFAGIAAGMELFGMTRYLSVPLAAAAVTLLVLRGSFHRVEHLLLALSAVFVAYLASGVLAHPDWGAAAHGLVVPTMPASRAAVLIATATVGTTLAPWGLSFIQSYAVDKRLTIEDLRYERADVVVGATLTGVIGAAVVVSCAATLHARGIVINDASDAARALAPLAGDLSARLFGVGLVGAALLAASVLPLSHAYSVCEFVGSSSSVDDHVADAPLFYGSFVALVVLASSLVLIPHAPLITILVVSQVVNAVLLIPLLAFMVGIARDPDLLGDHVSSRVSVAAYVLVLVLVTGCVLALGVLTLTG